MTKQEKLARSLARKWLNENRHSDGLPALNYLSPNWWKAYGSEFMGRAALYYPPDSPQK